VHVGLRFLPDGSANRHACKRQPSNELGARRGPTAPLRATLDMPNSDSQFLAGVETAWHNGECASIARRVYSASRARRDVAHRAKAKRDVGRPVPSLNAIDNSGVAAAE